MRKQRRRALGVFCVGLAALAAPGLLAGCAGPRLEAAAGPSRPSVTLTDAGIRLTLLPNTWRGSPSDLGRSYTPVEVRIENERTEEIQVRYGDFLAVDESRNQYRAVPPAEVARALSGGRRESGDPGWASVRRPPAATPLLAFHDPWWPYPSWPSRPWSPFFSPYYPYPFAGPEYPYRWPGAPAYDILTLGLREGRILPGARVEGFLYLQQATQKGTLLTLSWTPVSADGKPLATLSSQFRIVR
ncbi:MAG: hypothetical protein HYV46_11050 [candidate division NC10 bacterium]|nr:hypothetical protein [candidate division NC10 bacterium]MBI2456654.1 hypothetical protein [candidate division NC10 bacterium]